MDDGEGVVSVAVTPRETLCDGKFHLVKGLSCLKAGLYANTVQEFQFC